MKRPRYFHYISKSKLDILEPQLVGQGRFQGVSPKIEIAGFGLDLDFKEHASDSNPVRRLLPLLGSMKKQKLFKQISNVDTLNTSDYYEDDSEWFNGLFSFKGSFELDTPVRVITYVLWKTWKDSIILLVGSPLNILGERVERDGVLCQGTIATWTSILNFASANFTTDDIDFVGATEYPSLIQPEIDEDIPWLNWSQGVSDDSQVVVPLELFTAPSALAIGLLCAKYLVKLPYGNIDTAFKVFKKIDCNQRFDLPKWAYDLITESSSYHDGLDTIQKCKEIYIGSPLYTAI